MICRMEKKCFLKKKVALNAMFPWSDNKTATGRQKNNESRDFSQQLKYRKSREHYSKSEHYKLYSKLL